jgi:hypothetical protein
MIARHSARLSLPSEGFRSWPLQGKVAVCLAAAARKKGSHLGIRPDGARHERLGAVDLPVLRIVAGIDYAAHWRFGRDEAPDELPELRGEELDGALRRLEEHGLITAGDRREAIGYFLWSRLRPTADGWRVLGEWPPSAKADMGIALVHVLRALAEQSEEGEAKPLRRAAGAAGRLAGNVVFDVAKGEIRRVGGELSS